MHRVAALAVIIAASPAAAQPPFVIGLDYTLANGGAFETWDLGWRLEAGPFFRMGHWQATASASALFEIDTGRPERDSKWLTSVGLGARLAYHVTIDRHGALFLAAGFERLWLSGDGPVRRDCRQTKACIAGFYPEVPSYRAWAPQLRVGIGPYLHRPGYLLGGTFEVIVEPIALRDVPPAGISDIALYGAFTFSFGFGPKRSD